MKALFISHIREYNTYLNLLIFVEMENGGTVQVLTPGVGTLKKVTRREEKWLTCRRLWPCCWIGCCFCYCHGLFDFAAKQIRRA